MSPGYILIRDTIRLWSDWLVQRRAMWTPEVEDPRIMALAESYARAVKARKARAHIVAEMIRIRNSRLRWQRRRWAA